MNLRRILNLSVFAMLMNVGPAWAAKPQGKYFDRVITVIFENTNYIDTIKQPFFGQLARKGANLSNLMAITHPSQPNYIALTSGSLHGVSNNDSVALDVKNIVDLLESKQLTWKVYAEGYPGNCFTGAVNGNYARKHNPFISYLNIQKDPKRCANIVNADQFDVDVAKKQLPHYAFYIPDNRNNGHDTGVAYADRWYSAKFSKFVDHSLFPERNILLTTFDESGSGPMNQIYTSIVGLTVKPGEVNTPLTLYSLLRMIEDNWSLGSLNQQDAVAPIVPNIWK